MRRCKTVLAVVLMHWYLFMEILITNEKIPGFAVEFPVFKFQSQIALPIAWHLEF